MRRLAAVALVVTVGRILNGRLEELSFEDKLCLRALRRSKTSLHTASIEDLRDYLSGLSPVQMRGVLSNVKGILHEMLFVRAHDVPGAVSVARLHEHSNHAGSDVEFVVDDEVIREVQLKAVFSPADVTEHLSRYPDIDVYVTLEVFDRLAGSERVMSSGFANAELDERTRTALAAIHESDIGRELSENIATSALLVAAAQSRDILSGKPIDRGVLRSNAKTATLASLSTFFVETILG